MRRVRRIITVICQNCLGSKQIITGNGKQDCDVCNGTGETDSVVWEILPDEDDEHAHAIRLAGSLE